MSGFRLKLSKIRCDYKIFERVVSKGELITINLAKGGGQAIELKKVKN